MLLKSMVVASFMLMPIAAAEANGTPVLYPKAQALAEGVVTANPDMLDVLLHVTPPGKTKNIVVAAHLTAANGEDSGDDDIGVMKSGKPLVEVQKDGVRIGVLVQMQDNHHHAIGALGLMYPYHQGDDQKAVLARSYKIRDDLARQIPSRSALFSHL